MTKHFHVVLWLPLLFCALFLIYWINIYMNEVVEYERFVLEKQLNYATDSAVEAMLVDADLDADYSAARVQVDPQLAVKDFGHSLCLDFGYLPTDATITKVLRDNCKVIVIACFDGYYYFSLQPTTEGGWDLVQSPKIPYYYKKTYNGVEYQYCLTLDPTYGYYANPSLSDDTKYSLHSKDTYPLELTPSAAEQSTAITDSISNIINWTLYSQYNAGIEQAVDIPDMASKLRAYKTIDTPTIIAVVKGLKSSMSTAIIADGIAGSQVTVNDPVVAYTVESGALIKIEEEDGTSHDEPIPAGRWYAYSSWWHEHRPVDVNKLTNGKLYDNAYEAAEAGYDNLSFMYTD